MISFSLCIFKAYISLLELPDLTEELKKKDQSLLQNLTKVYVKSEGDNKVKVIP